MTTTGLDPRVEALRAQLEAEVRRRVLAEQRAERAEARARDLELWVVALRGLAQRLIDRLGGGRPNAVNGPEDVW